MLLQTKYSVGDKVFYATTISKKKTKTCPDCFGTKKWEAISPAGNQYEVDCPRCSAGYILTPELRLTYECYVGHVIPLTIGSVRIDTHDKNEKIQYMCRETGVGSGAIYNEGCLFEDQKDAEEAAEKYAQERNKNNPNLVAHYNKVVELKDYHIHTAKEHAINMDFNKYKWEVRDFMDELERCVSLDEVHKKISESEW